MKWAIVGPDTVEFRDGPAPSASEIHDIVGGWLEAVYNHPDIVGYINEDGKAQGLKINPIATTLFNLRYGDYIVGNCVVVGPPSEEGEDTDLLEHVARYIESLRLRVIAYEALDEPVKWTLRVIPHEALDEPVKWTK